MHIAIVGAGISGLAAARVLSGRGLRVTVFDRASDVGGVWNTTRHYPGQRTQNSRRTYRFSDFPMPAHYPDWPTAPQMQDYLTAYARERGLTKLLRLGVEVESATPDPGGGWTLGIREAEAGRRTSVRCDHLVIANGVFSDPAIPEFPSAGTFTAAGGELCHTTGFGDRERARGKHVVIVGYGKSACDVAEALSEVSASTTVIARRLLWKMPRSLGLPGAGYEQLALTRLGEAVFPYCEPNRIERFLHGPGRPLPNLVFAVLQWWVIRMLRWRELGLIPPARFSDIAEGTLSLVTEGFYEKVRHGRIAVRRERSITGLLAESGSPAVDLDSGERLPADIVLCATGFHQRVPFLPGEVHDLLVDDNGDFRLYRHILPSHVPDLTFAGYNSSTLSGLNAEVAALWTAELLAGRIRLPDKADREAWIDRRLHWMRTRTGGKHVHGTSVAPFSIHNLDEMLADLGTDVTWFTRVRQWFSPAHPAQYRHILR
jgi:cation diffusion facilitator CzcD-associated flavoprotein CzcO